MIKTKIENQHVHFNVTKIGMFSLRYHIVYLSIKSNYTKSMQNTFKEKTSYLPINKVFFSNEIYQEYGYNVNEPT